MFSDFADGNLYDHGDIAPCRKIKYAFYPPAISALVSDKRIKIPPKMHNEQRILSADIALMASSKGKNNDATSIFVNQLLLNDNGRSTPPVVKILPWILGVFGVVGLSFLGYSLLCRNDVPNISLSFNISNYCRCIWFCCICFNLTQIDDPHDAARTVAFAQPHQDIRQLRQTHVLPAL